MNGFQRSNIVQMHYSLQKNKMNSKHLFTTTTSTLLLCKDKTAVDLIRWSLDITVQITVLGKAQLTTGETISSIIVLKGKQGNIYRSFKSITDVMIRVQFIGGTQKAGVLNALILRSSQKCITKEEDPFQSPARNFH